MAVASPDPASDVVVVTPSDTVPLAVPCRAIRAGSTGNIAILTPDRFATGAPAVTLAFLAGETRAVRAVKIMATNTTSTPIEALI